MLLPLINVYFSPIIIIVVLLLLFVLLQGQEEEREELLLKVIAAAAGREAAFVPSPSRAAWRSSAVPCFCCLAS